MPLARQNNPITKWLIASIPLLIASALSSAQTTFIATGSIWKYNSTGTDLGTAWKEVVYNNDTSWSVGPSQLGYGDSDEATVIPGGPSTNRYPTYYFRHSFNVAIPHPYQAFTLKVRRDDGIVVYLNGNEVFRNNMPAGTPSYGTWASSTAADDGTSWLTAVLPLSLFANGSNVIAAEVHQANATSSDVSFDLQLTATLIRGPYLQLATSSSLYIRWRSDVLTDSKVSYGTASDNLNQVVSDLSATTEHVIQLTNLNPGTKYYYCVGSTSTKQHCDSANYFITAPVIGTEKITRIWATGDCGTNQPTQTAVMNAYQNFMGNNYTDIWLLLGDNAYNGGFDSEYQTNFFQPYMNGKIMKQTVLFPAPGNHDYNNSASLLESRTTPYFEIFSLPKAGEAGGIPSGTEMYYSYNYANIHFISLDSYGTESNKKLFDTTGAQIAWLKQDLAANTQKWTILYWHHPPYTMGSHNSDNESELVNIRNNVLRILDKYKVDLVLCGHSHNYERSKIMKGHYGLENTFNPGIHNLSTSSALYDGSSNSCPYIKSSNASVNEGILYVVAGSAGKLGDTAIAYPHNAMYYSNSLKGGSLYLEVNGNRLDAKWIDQNGTIADKFTIMKDVNQSTAMDVNYGDSAMLTASWQGVYQWSPQSSTAKAINVSPSVNTNYIVTDGNFNCVKDTFKVNVIAAQQQVSLSTGWNIISGNVIPVQAHMDSVFKNIVSNIILVKNNTGQTYIPSLGINNIGNWDYKQGYKVKTSARDTLTLCCTKADLATSLNLPVGWSIVSYLNSVPMSITTALNSLGNNIILVKNSTGQTYIPSLNINSIGNMQPGQGYQIKMSAPATLVYPQ